MGRISLTGALPQTPQASRTVASAVSASRVLMTCGLFRDLGWTRDYLANRVGMLIGGHGRGGRSTFWLFGRIWIVLSQNRGVQNHEGAENIVVTITPTAVHEAAAEHALALL